MIEIETIKAIRSGDRDAFRTFVEATADALYIMVFRLVPVEDEARDIVQDTYIRAWEKRSSLRSDSSMLHWIRRIALNMCYDYIRRRKRRGNWHQPFDNNQDPRIESDESAEDIVEAEEYARVLEKLSAMLSPGQKLVFVLSAVEEMTHDEIAEVTGMSKARIKSNLHHARKKIEKMKGKIY